MTKYIVLLRGINVGGHRKILMADLKQLFLELNYLNPTTYIQSGNVIFETSKTNISAIEKQISNGIQSSFGFDVPVIVRQVSDLKKIIRIFPYFDSNQDTKTYHITFLSQEPHKNDIFQFETLHFEGTQFKVIGKEVHLCVSIPFHKSKLSNVILEKNLKVKTTTRNWRTVNKLIELA